MKTVLFTTYNVLQIALLITTALACLYILIFAIAGLFYRKRAAHVPSRLRRFAVFIPGYKEDEVIVEVAEEALKQNYPTD